MKKCPKCGSFNIEPYMYQSVEVIKCIDCNFDGGSDYNIAPEQKISQKAKGKYSVYKAGGHRRTIKK